VGAGDRPRELPKAVSWRPVPASPDGIDLSAFLDSCGQDGLHDLVVEPGPRLLDAFLRHGLWDRLWLLRSPTSLGGGLGLVDPTLLAQGAISRTVDLGADEGRLLLNLSGPKERT
jgi:riboflavin biosynthesis pyrimidine reductase